MKILAAVILIFASIPALSNELRFQIGGNQAGYNTAFVTLKICDERARRCVLVERIQLDTGSSGLRIKREALAGLNLVEIRLDGFPASEKLMSCAIMAGGWGFWGSLARATVHLGDNVAPGVRLQIVESKPPAGTPCLTLDGLPQEQNGILGIGTSLSTPILSESSFLCRDHQCPSIPTPPSFTTTNPMAQLVKDNNGFLVRVPALMSPVERLEGRLIFGIGTQRNNRPPPSLAVCRPNQHDFFRVVFSGREFWTKFDTGTSSLLLPNSQSELALCPGADYQLCPDVAKSIKFDLYNAYGSVCSHTGLEVRPYNYSKEMLVNHNWVFPGMATVDHRVPADTFVIGLPFFYGRDVYFGLDGRKSRIGVGPYVAF